MVKSGSNKKKKTSKEKAFNVYKFERVNIMINKDNKNGICSFFASDYHFEMISLPVIEKEIENKKSVLVFTENNLENTIDKVLNSINLKEEKKDKIRKIDWNNKIDNKLDNLKMSNSEQETIVFIKGGENYIKNTNQKIREIITDKKIKVIDCYDINQMSCDLSEISQNYSEVLNTMGKTNL